MFCSRSGLVLATFLFPVLGFAATNSPLHQAGAAVGQSQAVSSKSKVVSKFHAPDKVVQLKANDISFTVTLPDNPTTGYNWYMVKCDEKLVTPISARYTAPKNKKLMGAPGSMSWTFRGTPDAFSVPRITRIELLYARAWDLAGARPYRIEVVTSTPH